MLKTRRFILKSVAATAIIRPLSAFADDVDVAIVGAGATGLAAAKALIKAGYKVQLLEARDRIGGRAYTDNSLGGVYDAGAAYIHFGDKNPWIKIAEKLKTEITPLYFGGGLRFSQFKNGKELNLIELAKLRLTTAKAREAMNDYEGKDISLLEAAGKDGEEAARSTGLFALGEDPQRVSINDYNQLYDGSNFAIPEGYGHLVSRYGTSLPVSLSTQVTAIDTTDKLAKLTTNQGVIRAKTVLITVPVGVLLAEGIRFNPPLPSLHQKALNGLRMGALTKIALKVSGNRADFGGFSFIRDSYNTKILSYELFPHNHNLIIAVMGGDEARALIKAGEKTAVDYIQSRLVTLLGENIKPHFLAGKLHGWANDPFALGSYALVKPGHVAARTYIREPISESLYYAGEASAGSASMTVGGATLEGVRIANIIALRLKLD